MYFNRIIDSVLLFHLVVIYAPTMLNQFLLGIKLCFEYFHKNSREKYVSITYVSDDAQGNEIFV